MGQLTVTILASRLPTLNIGPIALDVPVVLAPMAGITNTAFRRLCREYGGGLYVSEMITSRALVERTPESMRLIRHHESETLRSIQLYGVDPKTVIDAVTMLVAEDRADHIDLNFGCPVAKVTRRGGGAALPWKLGLFRAIVEGAVKAAGDVPVTVKMRKGIDEDHLTYLEAGRAAEGAGAASIALHARTAAEFYSGTADWNAITELKNVVSSTPVLGNGDIWSADDAIRMVEQTGADGVVVGRGCLGRPWLFGDLAAAFRARPPGAEARARPRIRRRRVPPARRAARGVLRGREPGVPRHPQARRLVLQGLPGRRRDPCGARDVELAAGARRPPREARPLAAVSRARRRRASAVAPGRPKRPTLPYGWLDSRELQETDVADMLDGEVHNSGG